MFIRSSYILRSCTGLAVLLQLSSATLAAQRPEIALRSGTKALNADVSSRFIQQVRASANGLHGFAVFRRNPTNADVALLERMGITVQHRLVHTAFVVRVARRARLDDPSLQTLVRYWASSEPRDRVAPEIWNGRLEKFVRRTGSGAMTSLVENRDSTINLIIQFHVDATRAEMQQILQPYRRQVAQQWPLRWRATLRKSDVMALAAFDKVRWIDAIPVSRGPDMDLVRQQLNLDAVQKFNEVTGAATGATGLGIRVGVHDSGGIDPANKDFDRLSSSASRVIVNQSGPGWHATYMAGIIAGTGLRSIDDDSWGQFNEGTSAYQWRGIAPHAELLNAPWFLPSTAAEFDAYRQLITMHGMAVSNHSYSISLSGEYGDAGHVHDAAIRGDDPGDGNPVPRVLHVHSAGNNGNMPSEIPGPYQRGFFALGNQLKNSLTVGDYFADQKRVSKLSSLGPTHDGRIKPDVVAPATAVTAAGYCNSNLGDNPAYYPDALGAPRACDGMPAGQTSRSSFYIRQRGTSVAAAVTSGVVALVLEKLKSSLNIAVNLASPLASTLRGVIIHSATDLVGYMFETEDGADGTLPVVGYDGPDFASGFGLVDAAAAVEVVQNRMVLESVIPATCQTQSFSINVPPGATAPIKVTLAWDDPASAVPEMSYSAPRLINDLDLVLIAPDGTKHYPWLLDQVTLDANDLPLSNVEQSCDTPISVRRTLAATPDPWFPGFDPLTGNLLSGNGAPRDDPINDSDLVGATRGKDHLNNVEQVVAAPVEGTWTVEVSGFHVPQGPQPFSLIGVQGGMITATPPKNLCAMYSGLCDNRLIGLCLRYPPLCATAAPPRISDRAVQLTFRHLYDRQVIDVVRLCDARPGCRSDSGERASPAMELLLPSDAQLFGLEVFDAAGRLVASDLSASRVKRLTIPPRIGPTFLIIRPLDGARVGAEYTVPIALTRRQ